MPASIAHMLIAHKGQKNLFGDDYVQAKGITQWAYYLHSRPKKFKSKAKA
jgi:hypothetical protein